MVEVAVKDFVLPNEQPIVALECRTAFENLSFKEKQYAYHLSKASWYGGLIVLIQVMLGFNCKKIFANLILNILKTSPESAPLFSLLHKVYSHEPGSTLRQDAAEPTGLTEDEFQVILIRILFREN